MNGLILTLAESEDSPYYCDVRFSDLAETYNRIERFLDSTQQRDSVTLSREQAALTKHCLDLINFSGHTEKRKRDLAEHIQQALDSGISDAKFPEVLEEMKDEITMEHQTKLNRLQEENIKTLKEFYLAVDECEIAWQPDNWEQVCERAHDLLFGEQPNTDILGEQEEKISNCIFVDCKQPNTEKQWFPETTNAEFMHFIGPHIHGMTEGQVLDAVLRYKTSQQPNTDTAALDWKKFDYSNPPESGVYWVLMCEPDYDIDVNDEGRLVGQVVGEKYNSYLVDLIRYEDWEGMPDGFKCVDLLDPDRANGWESESAVVLYAEVKKVRPPQQAIAHLQGEVEE